MSEKLTYKKSLSFGASDRPLVRAEQRFVDTIAALCEWFSHAEEYSVHYDAGHDDEKIIICIEVKR
jgi:hypothetical protein